MKAKSSSKVEQEPIGIVISRGPRQEQVPTFVAYVWGPDPEAPEETGKPKAA
jgi:hypothetical protein